MRSISARMRTVQSYSIRPYYLTYRRILIMDLIETIYSNAVVAILTLALPAISVLGYWA